MTPSEAVVLFVLIPLAGAVAGGVVVYRLGQRMDRRFEEAFGAEAILERARRRSCCRLNEADTTQDGASRSSLCR